LSGRFLRSYLAEAGDGGIVPSDPVEIEQMLVPYMLQKAVYELGYELNNRPGWALIPLRGIRYLCGAGA